MSEVKKPTKPTKRQLEKAAEGMYDALKAVQTSLKLKGEVDDGTEALINIAIQYAEEQTDS